jgi:hypothetical protein
MKLSRVTFLGVRGLADATYDLTDPATGEPRDVVVFTGPAASGKTRALEAIAAAKEVIGPCGPLQPGAPWIADDGAAAKVTLGLCLDDEERVYAGTEAAVVDGEATFFPDTPRGEADEGLAAVLERYDHRGNGKIEYFPVTRRIPQYAPFDGTGPLEQRGLRAGKDPRKYSFIPRFLQDLEGASAEGEAFASRLAALSTTLRWERGGGGKGAPRAFRSRGGPLVTPAELSDGEVNAVVFAATAIAIQLVRSIVLVDRPELYVDPAEIPRFLAGLSALGRGNQLVLASSSPAVLAAATNAAVVQLAPAAG